MEPAAERDRVGRFSDTITPKHKRSASTRAKGNPF